MVKDIIVTENNKKISDNEKELIVINIDGTNKFVNINEAKRIVANILMQIEMIEKNGD